MWALNYIIQHQGIHKDALCSKWREKGIDDTCMQIYWRKLWASDLLEKCKSFLWLINHKALMLGKWLQWRGKDGTYRSCNYDSESIKPCLWSARMQIYDLGRIIRILAACGMRHESLLHLVMLNGGLWKWTTIGCTQIWGSQNPQEAWLILASIGWNIWKYICLEWYLGETHTIANVITTIWIHLAASSHAQFDVVDPFVL